MVRVKPKPKFYCSVLDIALSRSPGRPACGHLKWRRESVFRASKPIEMLRMSRITRVPKTIRPLQIPIQPRNSTIQCFFVYPLSQPVLPWPMLSTRTLVWSAANAGGFLLPFPASWHSSKTAARLRFPLHTASPFRQRRDLTLTPVPTPLLPITSIQPLHFHTIAHSFAPRRHLIPSILNSFRALLPLTANSFFRVSLVFCPASSLKSRVSSHLPPLWKPKKVNLFLFNHFQPLLPKHPGWGISTFVRSHFLTFRPLDVRIFRPSNLQTFLLSATTWTQSAHPTIIARSRVQVHG
jgi:hypothetical protein